MFGKIVKTKKTSVESLKINKIVRRIVKFHKKIEKNNQI